MIVTAEWIAACRPQHVAEGIMRAYVKSLVCDAGSVSALKSAHDEHQMLNCPPTSYWNTLNERALANTTTMLSPSERSAMRIKINFVEGVK